jgi:hypothetical protein
MLRLPTLGEMDRASSVRIFLYTLPTDMRRGFDGLAEMVRSSLSQDPLDGSLFFFARAAVTVSRFSIGIKTVFLFGISASRKARSVFPPRRPARRAWRSRQARWPCCWRGSTSRASNARRD